MTKRILSYWMIAVVLSCGGEETLRQHTGFYAKVRGGDTWSCFEVRESLILGPDHYPVDDFEIDGNTVSYGHAITQGKITFESGGRATLIGKFIGFGVVSADFEKVNADDPRLAECR